MPLRKKNLKMQFYPLSERFEKSVQKPPMLGRVNLSVNYFALVVSSSLSLVIDINSVWLFCTWNVFLTMFIHRISIHRGFLIFQSKLQKQIGKVKPQKKLFFQRPGQLEMVGGGGGLKIPPKNVDSKFGPLKKNYSLWLPLLLFGKYISS